MKRYYADEGIPTLALALAEYLRADELKKLAQLTGTRLPTRKAELARHVVRHLEGEGLQLVWRSMDKLQQAAVAEVVHSDGTKLHPERFKAKYGNTPDWGSMNVYARDEAPSPLRFFFFGHAVMPDDLKTRLKAFVPRPAKAEIESREEVPETYDRPYEIWDDKTRKRKVGLEAVPLTVHELELSAQRELASVLRLVDTGKITVSDKTRKPTGSTIQRITAVLDNGDFYLYEPPTRKYYDENSGPIRAFAWSLILQAGRLVQLAGTRLQLTKAGRKALIDPAAETIHQLWSKWASATILDELSRIDCVKGQTGKGKRGLTALARRREAVLDALADCPEQCWIATDEFLRFVRASGRDYTVTRNPWDLYLITQEYGSLGYEDGERILEDRYILCVLLEYAATLGLIDVALIPPANARDDYRNMWGADELAYFSRYDGLMYFRINALGAYCLDLASSYSPSPLAIKPVLRVLPNLEIAAVGENLERGDRLALDAYAVSVSDFVWRLDGGTLLSAVEQGRSMEEIREFLAARSGDPLPDTVERLLADTAERCTRIRDRGPAQLVECDEPALAALIATDSRTRGHCMRAGERHLVVPAASESAFKRNLRDIGYLVAAGGSAVSTTRRARRGAKR